MQAKYGVSLRSHCAEVVGAAMSALKAGHYYSSACPRCIWVSCPSAACSHSSSPEGTGVEAGMQSHRIIEWFVLEDTLKTI